MKYIYIEMPDKLKYLIVGNTMYINVRHVLI